MALENKVYSHLQELGGSNYEIIDGEPDIKGWKVKMVLGSTIGEVDELLFDPQSRSVRYIVVQLDGEGVKPGKRKIIIPIGVAELDDKDDEVLLPGISLQQIEALPNYEKGKVSPEFEFLIRSVIDNTPDGTLRTEEYLGEEFYAHDHFNEDRFYSRTNLPEADDNLNAEKQDAGAESVRAVYRIVERPENRV